MSSQPILDAATPIASQSSQRFSAMRTAILLFLFVNCVYLITSTGRVRTIDEIDPVLQSDSLLLRHSTAIPQAVGSGIWFGKRDVHGIPRSAWPVGHAILVLPWTAIGHALAKLPGLPSANEDLAVSAGTCWSSATFAAIAVAASFLLFLQLGARPRIALVCSLLLAFATPLFVYSGWLYSEPATAAILLVSAWLLFGAGTSPSFSRAALASLLLAFSIHMRPANFVSAIVFLGATFLLDRPTKLTRLPYRTTVILATFVSLSVIIYLLRNQVLFGNPFDYGVPPSAENGKDLESWHNPVWVGVFGYLISPGKSAFLFAPPIVLGILGIPALWRRHRPLAFLCVALPVVNLLLYSIRTQWEGGYNYGPRYLVPSLVFLCLPIVMLFEGSPRWLRPAFCTSAVIGLVIQVIGLSTNVMEDMVRNHYYVGNWTYRMSYSPITGQLRLIWKYLHTPSPRLGFGWDRWFIFLHAAGAYWGLMVVIASLFVVGALVFGTLTWSATRHA
jgi:hypothetical protein